MIGFLRKLFSPRTGHLGSAASTPRPAEPHPGRHEPTTSISDREPGER